MNLKNLQPKQILKQCLNQLPRLAMNHVFSGMNGSLLIDIPPPPVKDIRP